MADDGGVVGKCPRVPPLHTVYGKINLLHIGQRADPSVLALVSIAQFKQTAWEQGKRSLVGV